MDARHAWLGRKLAEGFELGQEVVDKALARHKQQVDAFLQPRGPGALTWYYQVPQKTPPGEDPTPRAASQPSTARTQSSASDRGGSSRSARSTALPSPASAAGSQQSAFGARQAEAAAGPTPAAASHPQLFLLSGKAEPLLNKVVYFVRTNPKGVAEASINADVTVGELSAGALADYRCLLAELFLPVLREQSVAWDHASAQSTQDFLQGVAKFTASLAEATDITHSSVALREPDGAMVAAVPDLRPPALAKAAADEQLLAHLNATLEAWCTQTNALLNEVDPHGGDADESGPETEMEWWRGRLARLSALLDHLKSRTAKVVLGVCGAGRTKVYRGWRETEARAGEAANEARDNVKYLAAVDRALQPLRAGTPDAIIDALPPLVAAIAMLRSVARHYSSPQRLAGLLRKVANLLMRCCQEHILAPGRLWDQDRMLLVANLEAAVRVGEVYREQFQQLKDRAAKAPASGTSSAGAAAGAAAGWDIDPAAALGKFDLFAKRCRKLVGMFTTIDQFAALGRQTHIAGLEPMLVRFGVIVEDIRRKPYDLLDPARNLFDRDFLEFNVNINDLEASMQVFINQSFEHMHSTEHALHLLRQFRSVLQRDAFKPDLDAKYAVIFGSYAADLEVIGKLYEKHKHAPQLPRNAPPVAGNIMWARQLLHRIERPMQLFAANKALMSSKEARKVVRTYNRLARALVEFEIVWHTAWLRNVEGVKAALAAPLIVRHPDTGHFVVNFDLEVLQLMREARYLGRLGVAIPATARLVLTQEEKFKHYQGQLAFAVKEHERVVALIPTAVRPLLAPHLDDLERKLAPGMTLLTWSSMNIDGYLHRIHQGLARLEELVRRVADLLGGRVEAHLAAVAATLLVELSGDRGYSHGEFTAAQAKFVARQAEALTVRNEEVERAVEELVELVRGYPRENSEVPLDLLDCARLRKHYARLMYQAILEAVRRSFAAMKRRLVARTNYGVLFVERPFFDVSVQLSVPSVAMSPSLEDIQAAINATAKQMLQCTRRLRAWGGDPGAAASGATFYDMIARDREVVKAVLLLTGTIEGTKAEILDYLARFDKYAFLWQTDLAAEYTAFVATKPTLEAFEGELRRFTGIEAEIAAIPPVHHIGALSLETQALRQSLRAETAAWKAQFARKLHLQGAQQLKALEEYYKETGARLGRKMEDLDDVRAVMDTLQEVREKEADMEGTIGPCEELYALLARYEVQVAKEEADAVADLRYTWRRLRRSALDISDSLAKHQEGFQKTLVREVAVFGQDAAAFAADWHLNGPMLPGLDPLDAIERLKKFQQLFEVRKRKWDSCRSGEALFGLAVTPYPELEQLQEEITVLDRLYSLYKAVIDTLRGYGDYFWADVVEQVDAMADQVNSFQAQAKKLPKGLREWPAYASCRKLIDDFLAELPLFQALAHRAMRPRHWKELMEITGQALDLAPSVLRFQHLLALHLAEHADAVEELTAGAVKEESIELKLAAIAGQWAVAVLSFTDYKTRGLVALKPGETGELVEGLEESQLTLASMASNRYSIPFREQLNEWVVRLGTVSEVLEQWLAVQAMWMYMEAVFAGGDIVRQLPQEAKRFQNIDKNYMKVVAAAAESRSVVGTCYGNELMRTMLPHLLEQLELCQKSLSAYLETKRAEFPRFYFVSDPTLLEILSLGSDPPTVVPHFQSGLFDSLANVTFDKGDRLRMTEMWSQQGERVELEHPVEAKGNIEVWLQRLVEGMQGTMKALIKRGARNVHEMGLGEFIFSNPAQVALLGLQFQWTADVQAALMAAKSEKGALSKALRKAEAQLRELVAITLRPDLTRTQRISLETCITVHMHQKEALGELVRKKVRDPADFEWLKQCRFAWREDRDTVVISICDVDFEYSYEYLGVKERLVVTPLTDICYVTLSQALGMFLGGAPAGPAGTGKTETVKDLGSALGKYVVVFNCSDQMDYKGMGKIFKGLAQSGLWGCFDEFNRINLDVLSVCAQQVHCILSAIRERKKQFTFTDGTTVALDPRAGFFITMNPGYAGRQELPENLKALFRGVTMMMPNRQIIMKVKLAACGYQENDVLSKKFNVLYSLCEQQLSKQPHYDFGLRNILSVLRTAGASKRANPDKSETFLMMRTLRDMNMSKFVAEDVPLFLALIDDLFPGQRADRTAFTDISTALAKVVKERGLQMHPTWLNKCIQLYETYLVRHGIMLVGPSGSGKTTICECLAAALTEMGTKTVIWRMNPKAVTAPQMFGRMNAATGDWTDGVFAVLWRRASKAKNQHTWIVLDGPVDAIWIENLNTVLDDNKVLTLANGDRILMTPQMKAFFEPENLNNASPATVSRAGIIYVSDTELGWGPVAASWLQGRKEAEAAALRPCFDKYVQPMLDYVRTQLRPVMSNQAVCQVGTLLTLLEGCLLKPPAAATSSAAAASDAVATYERVFLYCLAWSVGGLLDQPDRPAFDAHLRTLSDQMPPKLDEGDTVYEFLVDEASSGWRHWRERVPAWTYPAAQERPKFAQLVIPTLDSVRYEKLLSLVHSVGKSSLLVGGPGTAKTTIVNQFLGRFSPDDSTAKTITFSYLTTPQIFQTGIESLVEKRQGRTYGPPGGKTMTVFVDDISMPAINEWGDQVTNEIVRQLLEQGGVYSLDKPIGDIKLFADTRYVAAMATPGGGKNDIPNRLKRHFAIFAVPQPSAASINSIFGALVAGRFAPDVFAAEVVAVARKLVPMTVSLWSGIQAKMLPTPAKFHYLFNMRELSKIFQGLLLAARDRFRSSGSVSFSEFHGPQSFAGGVTGAAGYLLGLWLHECERVFSDKLVSAEDKAWVATTLTHLCRSNFAGELVEQVAQPLHFVDFLREPVVDGNTGEVLDAHPSHYEAVPGGLPYIRQRVEALQRRYNEESKGARLELVLFDDALAHLTRIARLLAMERGSALLVGVGGSGKQSLSKLAAYIAGAYTFQITLTKMYGVGNLLEDIKALYRMAGLKGRKVAFIFSDADVKEEAFLEYINQMLMTGQVAGLFARDELDKMLNDVRPEFKKECPVVPDTYDALHAFFFGRVRDRLHVILCFSPVGAKFARRAQQFPGLIHGCTIDWFLPWPTEALTAVSGKFIDEFTMACPPSVKDALKMLMGSVHGSVTAACEEYYEQYRRRVSVTPKSYLAFIASYRALYARKWGDLQQLAAAINAGLQKMAEAKQDVHRLKGELAEKNVELAAAAAQAEALLAEISTSTAVAEKEKNKVAIIVDAVTRKAQEIAAVKDDAEKDLEAAKPALAAALAALNSITPKDIASLKALKNPPDIVKRIFDCVLLLRHLPVGKVVWQDVKGAMVLDGTYGEAVKMMGDIAFLAALMNFPKEAINDETVELLQPYLAAPDFNYESAKKASGNVAGLCNWTNAMCTYHEVAKVVEPKIEALRGAEAEMKAAEKEKEAAEALLATVQAKLDEMQAKFDAAMAQKQALEADAAATQRRMDNANALLAALAGEEARWTEQSRQFDDTIQRLTGDCAVAAGFISYAGPFNKEFRQLLAAREFAAGCARLSIPATPDLDVTTFLADATEVVQWTLQGLPTDDLSVQNGIMVARATRYPVLIDPQGQGRAWLVAREATAQLRVTQLNDPSFRLHLEECLSQGRPLLIENMEEELDPVLDPVLERRLIRRGRATYVPLADKEVDFDEGFRLYCTTRLPNPRFSPELSAKVTVVDFTVTAAGLEDQLLGKLILKEKAELEQQRGQLAEEVASYRGKIRQLEDDLLFRLSHSKGNLLDDTELIAVLADTKQTAGDVNQRLRGASENNRKINDACEEYRPVARRAALLYFLIAEFSTVNCMYQTSLSQFNRLYEQSIDTAERAAVTSKRIANIIDHMTYVIYLFVQRGLFERHKLTFTLMLANKVLLSAGRLREKDVSIFLRGPGALDIAGVKRKPKEWIPDGVWLNIVAMAGMDAFRDIAEVFARDEAAWRGWYDQEAPERAKVPEYEERLTKFERMCIVKAFREDRTLICAGDYIADVLGPRFVESVPLDMERAWAESNPRCPLICLLSPGADPTKLIEDVAKRKKIRTLGVSMGQGQEVIARRYMATAVVEGQWVLLQNTHLGLTYLAEVEQFLLKAESVHESFRLWITAEPHPHFSIGLLQMGIKITNEAPVGIRAGLRASYQWITQDMLDAVAGGAWRQLLYVMCFLHSIVQERRKFGPIGWNIPYEFNQSDLSACTVFLQNHLLEVDTARAAGPTWDTVRYMVAEIQYGGRITDDFDQLLMDTLAAKYFHQGVLAPKYVLHKDERAKLAYSVPEGAEAEAYRRAIEELPAVEGPEIFGLHPNADLTFRTLQVQEAVAVILDTQPKGGSAAGGISREEMVDKLAADLLSKCPKRFGGEEVREKLRKLPGGPVQPLTVHLRQEVDRLNTVLQLTQDTLQDLRLALAGTIALSPVLADALEALFNGRIPAQWLKRSWEAATLGAWFAGLLQRHEQLARWLSAGRPKAYWLTGFFNPQGFLTAVKQEVSRRHTADKWALDDVVLASEVTHPAKDYESLKEAPAEGVYIYGLYLDGCAWSAKENRLVDSEPKKLFHPLPVLYVTGVQTKDRKAAQVYEAPVYRVKRRTGQNYITTFALRTDSDRAKWIARGVALLCSID